LAIGHAEGEKIVVDVVRSRAPKFNPEEVTRQYCELLKEYGVLGVQGDKFSGDFASSAYQKYGVGYQRAEHSKSELYLEAEKLFKTGRLEIPNREPLLTQLRSLVRKTQAGGRDSVDSDAGQAEDEANVAWVLAGRAGAGVAIGYIGNCMPVGAGGFDDGTDELTRRMFRALVKPKTQMPIPHRFDEDSVRRTKELMAEKEAARKRNFRVFGGKK